MRGVAEEREVAAVCAALEPYEWRGFTPQMLARCVLGALDRHGVHELVARLPGAGVGDQEPVEPVERGDIRVAVLMEFLAGHPWRGLTLAAVSGQLVDVLAGWWRQWESLEAELGRLLEEGG